MSTPIFAAQWSDVLGALHGLLALVMLFAFVMALIFTFAVSAHNWKHISVASLVAALSYIATFLLGLVIYPRFRVEVRGKFLDTRAPGSTGLFEIKEHIAAIGVFVALAVVVLVLFGHLRRASTWRRQLFAALLAMLALIALLVCVLAYVLSSRR